FRRVVGKPEMIEQIPVVKMRWSPSKSMDIKQSTVAGNMQVIPELLEQGGVGEQQHLGTECYLYNSFVVLFHGDLGTGERITSLLQHHSMEHSPWQRYQYVIYVMGLFHLKMTCADAIYRIFIEPNGGREDVNSLMRFIGVLGVPEPRRVGLGCGRKDGGVCEDIRNYSRAHIPKHGTFKSNSAYSDQIVHIERNVQCFA
ncbi:hypothetical protein K438DRAFT_1603870, partial [Mycena galopus ATCC 62051]